MSNYELDETATGIHLRWARTFDINIQTTDEGVCVDIFTDGVEGEPVASCFAFFTDSAEPGRPLWTWQLFRYRDPSQEDLGVEYETSGKIVRSRLDALKGAMACPFASAHDGVVLQMWEDGGWIGVQHIYWKGAL